MRRTLHQFPAFIVLALGAILVVWGGYTCFRRAQPEPVAGEGQTPRFCPPTITEVLGLDSGSDRLQGLVVAGIGGVALWLSWHSLRHREEAS
jgi:hypothetical protein